MPDLVLYYTIDILSLIQFEVSASLESLGSEDYGTPALQVRIDPEAANFCRIANPSDIGCKVDTLA